MINGKIKTVLITGGATGIGRACALKYAHKGYSVIINYLSSEAQALALKDEIIAMGETCYIFQADVSCREQVDIMREQVEKLFKRIDVLVLCSGVSLVKLITDTTDEEYDRVMNINARGQFNCMRAFLPTMIQKKEGSIVCVSSVWGEHGASCEAVYAMSKSAVIGLSKSASLEVAPSGIRVNCICPGVIDTKMNDCFSNEEKDEITKKIPLGRFGKVEEVAELIFDISENEYITGQVVSINGGFAI